MATAIDFLDNSVVLAWLRRCDPVEVLADQAFPVGRGVQG
jgi:hypothetical protein